MSHSNICGWDLGIPAPPLSRGLEQVISLAMAPWSGGCFYPRHGMGVHVVRIVQRQTYSLEHLTPLSRQSLPLIAFSPELLFHLNLIPSGSGWEQHDCAFSILVVT